MLKCHRVFAVILIVGSAAVVPRMVRDASAQSAARNLVTYEDELFAAIADAREIPDLPEMSLPVGYREIRIRGHLSMVSTTPTPMLRLVQGPDGATRGELLLFRRLVLRPGNPAPRADERCAPLRDQHACVRSWPSKSDDWIAVASALEELDAWSISEPCEVINHPDGSSSLSGIVGDSGELYIQRLVGPSFTQYRCNAPSLRTSPEGQKAHDIDQYFLSLVGKIPYEFDRIAK